MASSHDNDAAWHVGSCVRTSYGVGVVVAADAADTADADADAAEQKPNDDDDDDDQNDNAHTNFVTVQLWRVPGHSVATAATATLRPDAILATLPAAPGLVTRVRQAGRSNDDWSQVLVHAYRHDRRSFVVSLWNDDASVATGRRISAKSGREEAAGAGAAASAASAASADGIDAMQPPQPEKSAPLPPLDDDDDLLWLVPIQNVQRARAAKFYPLLQALMQRGDQAATVAAHVARHETTQRLLASTSPKRTHPSGQTSLDQAPHEDQSNLEHAVPQLTTTIADEQRSELDAATAAQQVWQMVKDEELTTLLQHCQARLEILVDKDIPAATQHVLERAGIRISHHPPPSSPPGGSPNGNNIASSSSGNFNTRTAPTAASTSFGATVQASRAAALEHINELLHEAELGNVDALQQQLAAQFTSTFDALATAAKSDRGLQNLFGLVSDKTTEWQQATGRVLQTRSASLFMEGAARLQARAAALLGQQDSQWRTVGELGHNLIKSFTEGDAAVAKLKGLELGESLKSRLVGAIEMRSDSLGGLDGIIADALTSIQGSSSSSSSSSSNHNLDMKQMLTDLQKTATSTRHDAQETLIAVLSQRSQFRDVALLRLERVLCDLDHHLGGGGGGGGGANDDWLSPEQLARVARGEGGTAQLFAPLAQRAMQEIDTHLSAAETQMSNHPAVLQVLQRVRKIMSGEMSLTAVTDEIVSILNDEQLVATGETLIQHSEQLLDVLEGVSAGDGDTTMQDAMQMAKKAGITKDSVMRELEKLDVNKLLDTAGPAVSDDKARRELVSSATDIALDYLLRILPSMPVPPFEGVNDGLIYYISNLSMKGFKVRKEDIQIQLAGVRATKRDRPMAAAEHYSDALQSHSEHSQSSTAPEIRSVTSQESFDSATSIEYREVADEVRPTELLIIDIRRISAKLDDAAWSFEQTYLPYLKGNGKADVHLSNGAIRLQFELRKQRRKLEGRGDVWEPVLCLHDRSCSIGDVNLNLKGEGTLTWILNKLAATFKGPLRDYVVRTIVKMLSSRSGWLLERLNKVLSPYWDVILRTSKLQMDNLTEADDAVVTNFVSESDPKVVELVWRSSNPLGMNLLMNDKSGLLKVVEFPRGSQARLVCERRKLHPDGFKGATVIGVNGTDYDDQEELFDALRDPGRPKTVRFRLAESDDAESVRRFVAGDLDEEDVELPRTFSLRTIEFEQPEELGIDFAPSLDKLSLQVCGFLEGKDGIVLAAERDERIQIGDILTHVNDEIVALTTGKDPIANAIALLEDRAQTRPLRLTFFVPYMFQEIVHRPAPIPNVKESVGPGELVLHEFKDDTGRRVKIKRIEGVNGMAENSGLLIGDHVVFVNGIPVGAGCRWIGERNTPNLPEVNAMLANEANYPIGLTCARPIQNGTRGPAAELNDSSSETVCVTASSPDGLGLSLEQLSNGDIIIRDFMAVSGLFKDALRKYEDQNGRLYLSIDWLNGQFVPSYASKDMVVSALARSWKKDGTIEMWLCDDERRQWLRNELQQ